MFLSLNKKIILSIVAFFILCFGTFGYTLYSLYNSKLQEDQLFLHIKNQQYNELLFHYNTLKSSLNKETNLHTPLLRQNNLNEIYQKEDSRYQALRHNLNLIIASLAIFGVLIVLMIIFLHHLVLQPVIAFNQINNAIKQGIYQQRLNLPSKIIKDEFNILEQTYNSMLDNIETQITKIQEQKEFLQNILDGIPDAIRVLDFSGNIILTNAAYKQNLEQYPPQQKCYTSLLHRDTPCNESMTNCPLRSLRNQTKIKFIQQIPSDKQQYLSVNAAKINTDNQSLIIESFRDLSEDIKFSHQQKISSLGFLTAAIAHEIKNSLGSMRLIFESLEQKRISETETNKYITLLYNQLLECIKIPERLIKLAKLAPDEQQKINCTENIQEILALLDYEATHSGISIKLTAQENIPDLYGNESDFKMIILNLIQNAIKAMPSGGNLNIEISEHKSFIDIQISDTGIGISRQQLPHIFEPFYSGDTSGAHTGLGLSIVQSLLHNFNGKIKVKSKQNIGTCFNLKFPYKNKK